MTTSPVQQTKTIVSRAFTNYPSVVKEISTATKVQAIAFSHELYRLLRLLIKAVGIISFPLWILPFSLVMCLVIYVLDNLPHTHKVEVK